MLRQAYQRCHPIRDEKARKRWRQQQANRCQVCNGRGDWLGLAVHHVIRFRRSDEPTNWILLCATCHGRCHDDPRDGRLTIGMVVLLKWFEAPDEFSLPRLMELRGGPVELTEPPAWLMEKRWPGRRRAS